MVSVFPRCDTCGRRIWLWQHMGWIVRQGVVVSWHTCCGQPGWSR